MPIVSEQILAAAAVRCGSIGGASFMFKGSVVSSAWNMGIIRGGMRYCYAPVVFATEVRSEVRGLILVVDNQGEGREELNLASSLDHGSEFSSLRVLHCVAQTRLSVPGKDGKDTGNLTYESGWQPINGRSLALFFGVAVVLLSAQPLGAPK